MSKPPSVWMQIEIEQREAVLRDTWGHMAPEQNRHYEGRIVYAIGAYHCNSVVILVSDFPGLDDSPWFYESQDALIANVSWKPEQDSPRRKGYCDPGCVYEWRGGFKNFKWRTDDIRKLMDPNEKQF